MCSKLTVEALSVSAHQRKGAICTMLLHEIYQECDCFGICIFSHPFACQGVEIRTDVCKILLTADECPGQKLYGIT